MKILNLINLFSLMILTGCGQIPTTPYQENFTVPWLYTQGLKTTTTCTDSQNFFYQIVIQPDGSVNLHCGISGVDHSTSIPFSYSASISVPGPITSNSQLTCSIGNPNALAASYSFSNMRSIVGSYWYPTTLISCETR